MIPTYNGAEYLGESLGSVLAQDPGADYMQIQVIDDHSTVGDAEAVVRHLAGGRVGFHRQPRNVGHVANFNTCIERSVGMVVHVLHDDDTVRPGFYERLEAGLRQHPEAGAALTRHIYADSDGHWWSISPLERTTPGILDGWLKKIASGQRVATPSMVVRRSTYEVLGGFDPRSGRVGGEDWEMWVRIATRYPVWFEPEPLAVYRARRPGSLTGAADELALTTDMFGVTRIVESYLFDHLSSDDAHAALRRARKMYARWAVEATVQLAGAGNIRRSLGAARLAVRGGPTMIMLARLVAAFVWSGWVSLRRRQARVPAVARLVQRLVQARARRRARHARLQQDAHFLRAGLWITANPKMARHWRHGRPSRQLQRAKGIHSKPGLLRTLASLTWIRSNGTHSIFLPNAYKADAVLIDPATSVLRVLHTGPISRASIESRILLSRYLDTPIFEVLDGGRLIREEFVQGDDIASLPSNERIDAFKVLLAGYASLCAHEAIGSAGSLFDSAVQASMEVGLPGNLTLFVAAQAAAVRPDVRRWSLIPAHKDISAENIIVRRGRPVLLDFEWAGWAPFCYDPMWLIIREAATGNRHDLLEAYLEGRLDSELGALWESADLQLPPNKVAALVPIVLLSAYEAATTAGVTEPNRLRRYLERWLSLVQPYHGDEGRMSR